MSELPLNQKELDFIRVYTDKESSDTYCNGTRSYMQVYGTIDPNTAGVMANRLLRKAKIKDQIDVVMGEIELNVGRHFRTLDRKLDSLANEGKISKEELMAIRLLAEAKGELGSGTKIGIGIGINGYPKSCDDCPNDHRIHMNEILKKLRVDQEEANRLFNKSMEHVDKFVAKLKDGRELRIHHSKLVKDWFKGNQPQMPHNGYYRGQEYIPSKDDIESQKIKYDDLDIADLPKLEQTS